MPNDYRLTTKTMKELLEHLVKELAAEPAEVKVEETVENDGTTHLSFSVAPTDMGLVIGKSGRTIQAIRTLIKTAASKAGKKVFLELKEAS